MIDFKTLKVWELGHQIALCVYLFTKGYPLEERFGLTAQMRSSASSIPTNIAEGCGRSTDKDLARFCYMAMGSASELEYQLLLSKDLCYIKEEDYHQYSDKVIQLKKMLNSFIKKIKERD